MRNLLLLVLPICTLLLGTSCAKKTTAAVGDDGIDWVAQAKQYREDPAALRAFTETCEQNAAQLATAQQEIARYRTQSGTTSQELSTARANVEQANTQVQTLMQENQQLRGQITTLSAAKNDQVDTDKAVVQGVVFQVQLGAYAQNRVDTDLATEDALELQDQDGMQKVVVSQFRTYSNAAQLRERLKTMGVSGAFVVAKNNGQRITVDEALRMTGQN